MRSLLSFSTPRYPACSLAVCVVVGTVGTETVVGLFVGYTDCTADRAVAPTDPKERGTAVEAVGCGVGDWAIGVDKAGNPIDLEGVLAESIAG